MTLKQALDLGTWYGLNKLHLDRVNPLILIAGGGVLLLVLALMLFMGGGRGNRNSEAIREVKQTIGQVSEVVRGFRRVLQDKQVQELATIAMADEGRLPTLQQYLGGSIPELMEISLFGADLDNLKGAAMGPFGYAVLDMLITAAELGLAPVQVHGKDADAYLAMAIRVGEDENPTGYLLAKVRPGAIVTAFTDSLSSPGRLALVQYNGRFAKSKMIGFDRPPEQYARIDWLRVPGSLFRIGVKQKVTDWDTAGGLQLLLLIFGLLLLGFGVLFKLRPFLPPAELEEDPPGKGAQAPAMGSDIAGSETDGHTEEHDDRGPELTDFGFNLEKRKMALKRVLPPVELVESIFRAYDIRGVVGETLDAEIARQVGQVVGTLTLEQEASPVIIARDGRDSGPDLVEGMIAGISSTGCDVVDIGAVPTGVLYFAAYELGNGTGVMITGSHNPPDYNGFKMVIGGVTQSGKQITDMYKRIQSGNLRVGRGAVGNEDMLGQYREKIAADIRLQRPLKVVADCGNGIGGICAADVLRDIGAEVYPLFDEVDGSFPNHHPDPSEPENLEDLIDSVRLMDADLGVAFDGDADRLGVVTKNGEIIYADRLMMLFVKDILGRVPGATIIYDVKCTGHLQHVIEEAGGKAMMYKTGHSLIKNKMKEVDAPFAGEMSGHFFFKERWYGFDCGIYSAARLLEILATDQRDPQEVLNSLPDSVSTPELKVPTQEGENHLFVAELQEKGRFSDAKINTIDGVRADFADGWGLVRASNTTPVLVLRFDADDETALQRIMNIFRQQMLAINSELKLPF